MSPASADTSPAAADAALAPTPADAAPTSPTLAPSPDISVPAADFSSCAIAFISRAMALAAAGLKPIIIWRMASMRSRSCWMRARAISLRCAAPDGMAWMRATASRIFSRRSAAASSGLALLASASALPSLLIATFDEAVSAAGPLRATAAAPPARAVARLPARELFRSEAAVKVSTSMLLARSRGRPNVRPGAHVVQVRSVRIVLSNSRA
jgi:hypothetical protein